MRILQRASSAILFCQLSTIKMFPTKFKLVGDSAPPIRPKLIA